MLEGLVSTHPITVSLVDEPMKNVMQLKGNKLAVVIRHRRNLSTFVFDSKKHRNTIGSI
jgi:hypothetical protein